MNKPSKNQSRPKLLLFGLAELVLMFSVLACIDKMPLPSDIGDADQSDVFSAGDTTYLIINPIWDASFGFLSPVEISIAQDGHIFVADSAAGKIVVLKQSGATLPGFEALAELRDFLRNPLSPIDVDIDRKMNVFYINGTNEIYRWNQLWNDVGIDSISIGGTFYHVQSGDSLQLVAGTSEWIEKLKDPDWYLGFIEWGRDENIIDSLLYPHLFYYGSLGKNIIADKYYNSAMSKFSALSATKDQSNFLFVTDAYDNRIIQIDFERTISIKLKTGETIWAHGGVFSNTVTGEGTGAGRVNQPLGIDVDFEGNIYYSQKGDFFSVHKIKPAVAGTSVKYSSVYQQSENDIMDLDRFSSPADVAVDNNQTIYVANTGEREIQVFNAHGDFFKKAGVIEYRVDKKDWDPGDTTGIIIDSTDTYYVIEEKDLLISPKGIAVDTRGIIYICDPPASRIIRYRLSNILDEDLQPVP